jgi:hypothetical protein
MYPNRRRKKESTILPVGIIWCFALFAFGMGLLADLALLGVYTMAMTLAFMISPRIGLPAFVMVLPFELHLAEAMPISAFVTLMPGMIVGYLVYCMRVGRKAPFERGGIILGGALIAAALLSFASSDLPPQYRMFVSLCLMIAIFLVCASIMKHEREGLFFIGHGLIAASVIGGIGGFLYIGSSDYEVVREIGTGGTACDRWKRKGSSECCRIGPFYPDRECTSEKKGLLLSRTGRKGVSIGKQYDPEGPFYLVARIFPCCDGDAGNDRRLSRGIVCSYRCLDAFFRRSSEPISAFNLGIADHWDCDLFCYGFDVDLYRPGDPGRSVCVENGAPYLRTPIRSKGCDMDGDSRSACWQGVVFRHRFGYIPMDGGAGGILLLCPFGIR